MKENHIVKNRITPPGFSPIKLHFFIYSVILIFFFNKPVNGQIFFRETTFNEFNYPSGILDTDFVDYLLKREKLKFPKARTMHIVSYLTEDDPRTVVAYYSRLCGQRFYKLGDRLIYAFSEINKLSASRIEIYPVKNPRLANNFWPTRIDLFLISYPVAVGASENFNRTLDDLKAKAGSLTYEGELREDIAQLEIEELGPDAEVFVIATDNSFEKVHAFFRRRYGRVRVIPAMDGNVSMRDFDLDATRAAGLNRKDTELYIRVEENPIIIDRSGNSQVYHGYTFIKYIFWHNVDEE
ncbi:hypothetical protein JXQ31_01445 [candidate division KSB1 bacterium]|nr:hypothetical protein [candidate division KSB1 bacterium]